MFDNVYASLSLSDFSAAALRAASDQAPLNFASRSIRFGLWRQRLINFFTLRPFMGRKWQKLKDEAEYQAFRNAVAAARKYTSPGVIDAAVSSQRRSDSPLNRSKVMRILSFVEAGDSKGQQSAGRQLALRQLRGGGYANPTYQFYETSHGRIDDKD